MSAALKGKTAPEAEDLFERFHKMVVEGDGSQAEGLGKLAVLKGVADFPTRVKCASLAWHAMHSALRGDAQPATTE
jgi:nitrogen fixation NifU-like protein